MNSLRTAFSLVFQRSVDMHGKGYVPTRTFPKIFRTFGSSIINNDESNNINDHKQFNPKDQILQSYSNRNPRNMEMLRLARKPKGYDLDAVPPNYWYRLVTLLFKIKHNLFIAYDTQLIMYRTAKLDCPHFRLEMQHMFRKMSSVPPFYVHAPSPIYTPWQITVQNPLPRP